MSVLTLLKETTTQLFNSSEYGADLSRSRLVEKARKTYVEFLKLYS